MLRWSEAFADSRPVLVSDLADVAMGRWPIYAPAVQDAGIRAVFAFPLQVGAARLGSSTCSARISDRCPGRNWRGAHLRRSCRDRTARRTGVEQAKGAIAQTHNIDVDAAFNVICAYARRTNRTLSDVANLIVTDLSSLPELATPDQAKAESLLTAVAVPARIDGNRHVPADGSCA